MDAASDDARLSRVHAEGSDQLKGGLFLWLTVATVAAVYAIYFDLLVTGSGTSPFL
jgi:hypothetical protein